MDGTGYRIASARGLLIFERFADDLLGGSTSPPQGRDVEADRDAVRDAVRRAHQRMSRRRRLVSRRS